MTTYGKIWDNMGKYGITMMNQWVKGYPTFRQTMTNHDKPYKPMFHESNWRCSCQNSRASMAKFGGINDKLEIFMEEMTTWRCSSSGNPCLFTFI